MSKPVILIPIGKQGQLAPRGEIQAVITSCNMQYIHSVVRAGGAPVLLPCMTDKEAIRAALQVADALLLTGGGDILSLAYGEEPHPASKYQDPVRDEMELEVTRLALERGLPVLGICRGIQLLNVALGGTLIQDVPSQVRGAVKHYSQGLDTVLLHTIEIEEDSLLSRLFQTSSTAVNSYHHQAVNELGQGLRINCRARDGVIEGIEAADGRPILGVQFHPEELTERYSRFQALFDWLIQAAGGDRSQEAESSVTVAHLQNHS
jgi:gamma-glutamyl-gamma-aminobutyrate hydrolase PuuD